jgi:hypothetical protein
MRTKATLDGLLKTMGSDVVFHREDGGTRCPCVSPEGFRMPAFHRMNPTAPICNEQGFLNPTIIEVRTKAAIQPPRLRGNRGAQRVDLLLGEVESGDRIGIFPVESAGVRMDFDAWSDAGEDYITYDGKRYLVVELTKSLTSTVTPMATGKSVCA